MGHRVLHRYKKEIPVTHNYGLLYNFYTVLDARGIAPAGWRVPTNTDITALKNYLNANFADTAFALRETGTDFWNTNSGTNNVGFSARGSARRSTGFQSLKGAFNMWVNYWFLDSHGDSIQFLDTSLDVIYTYSSRPNGMSIRFLKADSSNPGTVADYDGNIYDTININGQIWTKQNLKVRHFNNGDPIPFEGVNSGYFTDTEWETLTSAACCPPDGNWNNV